MGAMTASAMSVVSSRLIPSARISASSGALRPPCYYIIISAFEIHIAHDRVSLCLSDSNRPIGVFPTPGDQH